jgi:hypothetical protein
MPLDPETIRTAILDRARAKLGLPSREDLAIKRAEEQRRAAAAASSLESADVGRQLTRAQLEAIPGERALNDEYKRSQIERNLREPQPRSEPSTLLERIMAMPPDQQAAALKLHREMNPRESGGSSQPRTGWQPQFDQTTGRLVGYYHPATETFRAAGEGNLPAGTRGNAIPAGEMEKRGMLQSMLSDATKLQELIGPADRPTEAGSKIGFWSGKAQDVRASGALAPLGVDAPPDSVLEMIHITDNISDMLLRARSGAQINEQEYQRLRKLMPNPRTAPETFRINLSRFITETNNILAARQGGTPTQPGAGGAEAPPRPPSVPPEAQWDPATRKWRL